MDQTVPGTQKEITFRQWVNDFSDILYSYALKRLMNEEQCKDLLQETFLAAWRNIDHFRGDASVKSWLFVLLKSKIIDYYRHLKAKPVFESLLQEHNDNFFFDETGHWRKGMYPTDWSFNLNDPTNASDFRLVFQSCSSKLKELQNAVFVMRYIDGLESEVICKELGITPSNYWVLIHRAKLQLRACIEKNWMEK